MAERKQATILAKDYMRGEKQKVQLQGHLKCAARKSLLRKFSSFVYSLYSLVQLGAYVQPFQKKKTVHMYNHSCQHWIRT
jgi:hypothetical protein